MFSVVALMLIALYQCRNKLCTIAGGEQCFGARPDSPGVSTATVGGSKWRAGAATSLAVLRSPVFYVMRSTCALLADVTVDAMRVAYGTLSEESFQTTSSWRRRPTTGARLPATAPLGPTARGLRCDSDRSCVLQRAAAPAWMRSTASSACACWSRLCTRGPGEHRTTALSCSCSSARDNITQLMHLLSA